MMEQLKIHRIAMLILLTGLFATPGYAAVSQISANFSSASIVVGPDVNTCAVGIQGAIRYTSSTPGVLAYCDGVTSGWVAMGAASAAGSNTYVQFNSGGTALGGSSGYIYDIVNNIMTIANSGTGAMRAGNGAIALPSHAFAASNSTGMYMSGTGTALDFSVGGIEALQLANTASGVNYLNFTPGATGTAPSITNVGSDTNGVGLGVSFTGKTATAAGVGGAVTASAGAGNGVGAGGAVSISGGTAGTTGNGGSVSLTAGNGGSVSGNGGAVTLTAGSVTSGTIGSILGKIGATTYMTIQPPGATGASVVFNGNAAVIIPQGTTAQRPSSGVNGMMRYNIDKTQFEAYQAAAWTRLLAGPVSLDDLSDIVINYSSSTSGATNSIYSMFLGSNSPASTATAGSGYNTAFGDFSLSAITSGKENTGFGFLALSSVTTGNYNTAIGSYAGAKITTGDSNTAIGDAPMWNQFVTGSRNTGAGGISNITSGSDNTALGIAALDSIQTGNQNVGLGYNVGHTGDNSFNTVVNDGWAVINYASATYDVLFVTLGGLGNVDTHSDNVGAGDHIFVNLSGGNDNIAIGIDGAYYLTSGTNNIFIGDNAGFYVGKTTSSYNIVIGSGVTADAVTLTNEMDVGDLIFASTGGTQYIKIDANQHMNYHGTAPTQTTTTCGNASFSAAGNDNSFTITTGTTGATTCALTFSSAWSTTPVCVVTPAVAQTVYISALSTTAMTLTFSASTASRTFYTECRTYQ